MVKKYISMLFIVLSNIGIIILSGMLASIVPGLITKMTAIDNETLLRFIVLLIFLFLISFSFIIPMKNTGDTFFNKIFKFEKNLLFVLYLGMIVYILLIRNNNFIHLINIIPFKTIILRFFDFLTIPSDFKIYSFFRVIIIPIIYLIPVFMHLNIKNTKKYYIYSVIIVFSVEILKFVFNRSFNIDYIILGLYGAYLSNFIKNISIFISETYKYKINEFYK